MEDKVIPPETAATTVVLTCSAASEMTADGASVCEFVEQEESSIMDSQCNESTKWTNEKHSLYLKSIEESFVDELYNSLDMLSCQTQNTGCSDAVSVWKNHPDNACDSYGQFKVLQRGCWTKKSFKRQTSYPKHANRPQFSPGNHWIQRFRNGSIKRLGSIATSLQYPVPVPVPDPQLDQEPSCSNIEVTDQNFGEDTSCSRKRARASDIGDSINDQVVPHYTSAAAENTGRYVSPKE